MTASSRRRFLGLLAAASLSGCSAPTNPFRITPDPVRLDGAALAEAVSGESPSVPRPVPVDVEEAYLAERVDASRRRLSSVPDPLDGTHVPNEAIRLELNEGRTAAEESLRAAEDATAPLEGMAAVRRGRQHVRFLTAGWETVEDELGYDAVEAERAGVREAVDDFRASWRYVGSDPIRALVVHRLVEWRVKDAIRSLSRRGPHHSPIREDPIAVGRFAGQVAEAQASLDDARYLRDRFETSLDTQRPFRERFRAAAASLTSRIEERSADLPDGDEREPSSLVDGSVDDRAAGKALGDLYRTLVHSDHIDERRRRGEYPGAVDAAHGWLVDDRSFRSLRRQVESGDHAPIEMASDVRDLRAAAIAAIEDAAAERTHPLLDGAVLADVTDWVAFADERIAEEAGDDRIELEWIDREVGAYVAAREIARATAPATATVVAALRGE